MSTSIVLKTKVQTIYYEDHQDNLGKQYDTSAKRISLLEASDILLDRGIQYKELLKVKYETIQLEIPIEQVEQYII